MQVQRAIKTRPSELAALQQQHKDAVSSLTQARSKLSSTSSEEVDLAAKVKSTMIKLEEAKSSQASTQTRSQVT